MKSSNTVSNKALTDFLEDSAKVHVTLSRGVTNALLQEFDLLCKTHTYVPNEDPKQAALHPKMRWTKCCSRCGAKGR